MYVVFNQICTVVKWVRSDNSACFLDCYMNMIPNDGMVQKMLGCSHVHCAKITRLSHIPNWKHTWWYTLKTDSLLVHLATNVSNNCPSWETILWYTWTSRQKLSQFGIQRKNVNCVENFSLTPNVWRNIFKQYTVN